VRDELPAPAGDALVVPEKLRNRPVRRVSHLEGRTIVGVGAQAREIPYRFTAADFELVSSSGNPAELDAIRFRETGRRPAPGSRLVVNYYPIQTDPVPLTDLNVGSVIRTLVETIAREVAVAHLQLEHVYRSAFLATAEGDALDKVVALVGVARLPGGHPVARVRFTRQSGVAGTITVPVGTPLTDDAGNRYLTLTAVTLEPNETTREVMAGGELTGTAEIEEGALRLETLIAGVTTATNVQPARKLAVPESDEDLRRRARGALHGTVRGTLDALRFGLRSIEGVKDVSLIEAPHGVPGEVRVEVAYADPSDAVKARVARAIEELRPAGIRVVSGEASRLRVTVRVELTLTGSSLSGAELEDVQRGVNDRVLAYLGKLPPGGAVRRARLAQAAMADERVADARILLTPTAQSAVEELTLDTGVVLDVEPRFTFAPPVFEQAGAAVPTTATVSATLPVHLAPGVTLAQATEAIALALDGFLASRRVDAPLTVDALAAAIRDDTRFALVRADVIVTVEGGGRFLQLTDGLGSYAPGTNETLAKGVVDIPPREGGV
jgi:uncharacterized phage protein gp47/JayE